ARPRGGAPDRRPDRRHARRRPRGGGPGRRGPRRSAARVHPQPARRRPRAERMTIPEAAGWNTWDVRYHTGWTHLPGGLRLRFGLRGPDGTVFDGFTWRHGLVRLGHHTVDGRYAAVTVTAHGATLRLEASGGEELTILATGTPGAELVVMLDEAPGFAGLPVT